jgi:DNA-binding NtrC family response regulator
MNHKPTILIVDDDPMTRESLRQALEVSGFAVVEAEDASATLDKLHDHFINIVLLDIYLPGQSGLDLLKEIRKINQDTKVVMITGYASLASAIEALDGAAFAYMEKPIDMKKLMATLARAIEQQHEELSLRKPLSARLRQLT